MRIAIGDQLSNYFDKKSALDEAEIIACLPPKHQRDLVMSIYKPYLKDCPLMQGLDSSIVSRLCLVMRPYLAIAGDMIVTEGEVGEEMYLITRGAVKLESITYPSYTARMWEDGAFFGELPLLDCGSTDTHGKPVLHIYSAIALIDSHCTYITRLDLDEINRKRPILKATMTRFALQRAVRFGVDNDISRANRARAECRTDTKAELHEGFREVAVIVEAAIDRIAVVKLATESDPAFQALPASAKAMFHDMAGVKEELGSILKLAAKLKIEAPSRLTTPD